MTKAGPTIGGSRLAAPHAGGRDAGSVQRVRRYLEYLLKDRTDSARFITDPLGFESLNADMLRANFIKSKGDALSAAIWQLPDAHGRHRIDLSGGRSRFTLPDAVAVRAKSLVAAARHDCAGAVGREDFAAAVCDPEYFHYLDLCLSGFDVLRGTLLEGLEIGPDDLAEAEQCHHAPARRQAKAMLEERLRGHIRQLLGEHSEECTVGIVAGSSVYLAAFILESVMQPGSVLLVPEFTFYGTLNCILPLFRARADAPDCSVALIATSPSNGHKLTADELGSTLRRLADAARRPGALWLTSPTNLGAEYRLAELEAIAELVAAADLPVISDEIFAGLGSIDHHVSPMHVAAFGDRLIVINTSSKYFSFYDGDHLLHSELAERDGVLTEDVNTWSGGMSYYLTRNAGWHDAISHSMSRHPFSLTRLLFAISVAEELTPKLAAVRSRAYDADRDTILSALAGYVETSPVGGSGTRPRLLVWPDAGYSLGIAIPGAIAKGAGIVDAAQLAGYLAATQAMRLDVVAGGADPALLALRLNYSQSAEMLCEAGRRLRDGLAMLASCDDYARTLPPEVIDLATDTLSIRRARFLAFPANRGRGC